jgi:hypothetical protein
MKTIMITDKDSGPLPEERLKACERAIGGSEGVRARRLLEIRQDRLYYHTGNDYSTFEEYASARWGISSRSHCDRLCAYGRFLNLLDETAGTGPMGEWAVFLCERAYRELDGLDVDQKQEAIAHILDHAKKGGAAPLSQIETRRMAAKIMKVSPSFKKGSSQKLKVTEGLPVEPMLDNITKEDSHGIEEGALMIIRGMKSGDTESFLAGLLQILDKGPSALEDVVKCKQPNRAKVKAAAYLERVKKAKAA